AFAWAGAFVVFGTLCALCAARFTSAPASAVPTVEEADAGAPRPPWTRRLLWVALSACASMALLATTNQLCQEVASIPFLWVLPLCLYLLSFILCFESDRIYRRAIFGPALVVGIGAAGFVLKQGFDAPLWLQVLAAVFALFAVCMVCHGELVRLKPGTRDLTAFYLMVALGGAAGGIFVGLVAPRIFQGFWEYHLALVADRLLVLIALAVDERA